MKTTSAVLAVVACLAVAVVPAATASEKQPVTASGETPPVSIEISPGQGIYENTRNGWWEARSTAEFSVRVTDTGDQDLDELSAYISLPREIEVIGYSGDGWDCWDVEGGIECHNGHIVVPDEAWPTLTVRSIVLQHMNEADSIDVYVTTGSYGWAHEGVPFKTNTST